MKKIISIVLAMVMFLTSCGRLQENVQEIVEGALSSEKIDVSLEEMTLANAIIFGHDDTVKEIVENGKGIDINQFATQKKWSSEKYNNPLSLAMGCNKDEIMYYLIEKGADVKKVNLKGKNIATCLPNFQYSNQKRYLNMLVEQEIDFNVRDDYGNNVIDAVLINTIQYDNKDWELVQVLLDKGAKITSHTLEKMLECGNYGSTNLPKIVNYLMDNDELITVDDIYIKAILSDSESVRKQMPDVKKEDEIKKLGYLVAAFCDKETLDYFLDINNNIEWIEYKMLNAASRAGNIENIRYLVEERGFSEVVEAQRYCLVMEYAEANGYYEITEYLIEKGFKIPSISDSNKRGRANLLAINVVTGDWERLEYNLSHRERVTDCIMVPLRTAVDVNNMEMFKYLFDFAMDTNKELVYKSIVNECEHDTEMMEYVINRMEFTKEDLTDALDTAVSYYNVECIRVLLEAGADPNAGDIPLSAVYRDNLEILKLLVEHGMDINYTTESGTGVLGYGAQFSNGCLNYLLDQGIDISNGSGNECALIVAVNTGRIQNMKDLIAAGIDTSVTNDDGNTAYDMAVIIGNEEILQILENK